ncbi:hypothetical protein BGY98DRAFT_933092 [Russula aff. rugulosa BPL654]|nr:hypothetical protein BGY98DRAFT_933092 [Russula aff. rugulosa BPL654]
MRPALALLSDFLSSLLYSGPVQMVTGSAEATGLFLAFGQHTTQHFSVEYTRTIEDLLTTHPELTISIVQAKRDPTLVDFKRTRHLILEAVKRPRNNIKDLKAIKFQKAESKAAALQAWDQRFYDTPHTPKPMTAR